MGDFLEWAQKATKCLKKGSVGAKRGIGWLGDSLGRGWEGADAGVEEAEGRGVGLNGEGGEVANLETAAHFPPI